MMKLLLVFMMVYTCLAELPSMTLMNELLHFCLQNGHKSIVFSDENYSAIHQKRKISQIWILCRKQKSKIYLKGQVFIDWTTTFITIEPEAISCLFFHNLVCAIHSSSVKPQRASKKWWKFVFVGCQFYWKLFFIISTKAEKKTFSILRELWAFVSFGHYLLVILGEFVYFDQDLGFAKIVKKLYLTRFCK